MSPLASLLVLLGCGACSPGSDSEPSSMAGGIWAGGGFGCLQHGAAFSCRLLDYYISDYGQAALPSGPLSFVSLDTFGSCVIREDGSGSCFGDMDGAACARSAEGTIQCWGYDYEGNVTSPSGSWTSFILPSGFLCMLDDDGRISCSGSEAVADAAIPTGEGFHSLTGGLSFACALDVDGRAVCWGDNRVGQLDAPEDVFVQIAAGDYFTCGVMQDDQVKCWGCREEAAASPERYCSWDEPAPWWVPS